MQVIPIAKNQNVLDLGDLKSFHSYNSIVADYYTYGELIVYGNTWDTSNTTRKYFYEFIDMYVKELDLSKQRNKKQYIKKLIEKGVIKNV